MSEKIVRIIIKAPLQSWGLDAVSYSYRGTEDKPSFSGVLGMVCAALGISFRNEPEKVKQLRDSIKMDFFEFHKGKRLEDFQGAGGGVDRQSEYGKKCIPRDANSGAGKIYNKEYIQDAYFEALLYTDSLTADTIAESLKSPRWFLFAGRKSCMLSYPPFGGVFDGFSEVERQWETDNLKPYKAYRQSDSGFPVKDYPACLGDNRTVVRLMEVSDWP